MKYLVKFRKNNSHWDISWFTIETEAAAFAARLQNAGYTTELNRVGNWDKTEMICGDPNHHLDWIDD